MTEFEAVLQECLQDLEQGATDVDECLRRHPTFARELEPILFANAYLERAGKAHVSSAFKARVRTRLIQDMQVHPRRPARAAFPWMRLAAGFAAVLLALLATGTAYAQRALPGNAFYPWKLASEDAWRAVSPDPVETDLLLTERRVEELKAIQDDPALRAQTLEEYFETVARLRSQANSDDDFRVRQRLDAQADMLKKLGILLSQPKPTPLSTESSVEPADSPTLTATPGPILQRPSAVPTILPQSTPTIQVPPELEVDPPTFELPTVEIPPELAPTFAIPPPIR